MKKTNLLKTKLIGILATVLFVGVALSVTVLVDRMRPYLPDDSGAIDLIGASSSGSDTLRPTEHTTEPGTAGPSSPDHSTDPAAPDSTDPASPDSTGPVAPDATDAVGSKENRPSDPTPGSNAGAAAKPGFEAGDDKTVWTTDTPIEIFRISYENGEPVITVNSDDGEKVIAPGTSNSYTFKLKNTGNTSIDYRLTVDAYFTPSDLRIPIRAKLSRYDGRWLVGSADGYGTVDALDAVEDSASLSAGRYTYYTLEWEWPFESGDDAYDTLLGNRATEEDLLFTVVLRTTAEEGGGGGGIEPPKTGDSLGTIFWGALIAGGMTVLLIVVIPGRRRDSDDDSRTAEAGDR